jgi:DNA-binding IclR family transcriptional regulator
MTHESTSRTVQAVQITLDVIEVLRERKGAGVTELAEALDHSKGTIHGHLTTLLGNGYLVKEGSTYYLSLRYFELANVARDRISIYSAVEDELDDLAEECGELAQFAVEEHGKAVYLYKTGGEKAVQTASSVGTREYMHCIALGKAMLSRMPEDRIDEIVDRYGLPSFTDETITDREDLHEELATISERGYAFDYEERIDGLRCVAAPVQNGADVLGAVSVSGPSRRMDGDFYRESLPQMVTRSANVIEINSQFA